MKKWQWKISAMVAASAVICCTTVRAESELPPMPEDVIAHPTGLYSSAGNAEQTRQVLYQESDEPEESTPFQEEPQPPVTPDEAYELPADDSPETLSTDDGQVIDSLDACANCGGCRHHMQACPGCGGGVFGGLLSDISIGGWIDQGITSNSRMTNDRFNGPVTFNDREGEYQLNQIWVYAEKEIDTRGQGFDVGGRVDFVYGTDWRFTQSIGLEDRWNSERFYGAALPQLYADIGFNELSVRIGHFYTIIGYEVVAAPENFFYSHTYAMQYGEPFTHTGMLASYPLGDRITVSAGFDRGWDTWEDNNHDLAVLSGVSATSYDGASTLAFGVTVGDQDDAGQNNRSMYSLVFTQQVTDRLQYVLQHDYGVEFDGGVHVNGVASEDAQWYGINQYLLYDINDCWSIGFRYEWFRDDDGARVGGIGAPHGWTLGPDLAGGQIGWAGSFFAASLGINWKPTDYIIVRPECRWDWYDGPVDGAGQLPYDAGNEANQFTFATDLILTF